MESIAKQAEVFPSIHCSRKASFRQKNHKLFRFTILNKRLFPSGTSPLGRLLKWMGRRAISEFQVKQTTYPNAGRNWYIVGRPGGKRIRAWFDTKLVAQAEATRRNLSIQRFGQQAATFSGALAYMAMECQSRLQGLRAKDIKVHLDTTAVGEAWKECNKRLYDFRLERFSGRSRPDR
jgi:hypothetical protein